MDHIENGQSEEPHIIEFRSLGEVETRVNDLYAKYGHGEQNIYEFVREAMRVYAASIDYFSRQKNLQDKPFPMQNALSELNSSRNSAEAYKVGYNSTYETVRLKRITDLNSLLSPEIVKLINPHHFQMLAGSLEETEKVSSWDRFIQNIRNANLTQEMKDIYLLIAMKMNMRQSIVSLVSSRLDIKKLEKLTISDPRTNLNFFLNNKPKPGDTKTEGLNYSLGRYDRLQKELIKLLKNKFGSEEQLNSITRCFTSLFYARSEIISRSDSFNDFKVICYKLLDLGHFAMAEQIIQDKMLREPFNFTDAALESFEVTHDDIKKHYAGIKSSNENDWQGFLVDIRVYQVELSTTMYRGASAKEEEMYKLLERAINIVKPQGVHFNRDNLSEIVIYNRVLHDRARER